VRVLIIDPYYPEFIETHYEQKRELETRTYTEQLSALMARCFSTSDVYSRCLRELGHEAAELTSNCWPLQVKWAEENGRLRSLRWLSALAQRPQGKARLLERIAAAQIDNWNPDILYFQSLLAFSLQELDRLRNEGRVLVGQIASLPPDPERLRRFDLLISSFPHFVERFRAQGIASEYQKLGFDEAVLDRLRDQGVDPTPTADRPHGVSIVTGLNPQVHRRRVALLDRLCRCLDIEVWGYGAGSLRRDSPILDRYRGQAWGLDMYRILARSKIVVNAHEDVGESHANNMRLYEATGSGALLMTDGYENLSEILEPGREVVTYDGVDDLIEKVQYYLAHETERINIAAAGQARTLTEHTYSHRVEELVGWLGRYT
jgi:spore maturation protein CgeB